MTGEGTEAMPAVRLDIRPRVVSVCRANLALSSDERSRISSYLNAEEQQRAACFRFPGDRDRFQASRGMLRHLLASWLDASPHAVHIGYTRAGKPFLPDHPDHRFNLSHAADVLLVALAHGREIGVDVEQVFSEAVVAEIGRTVLSCPERRLLENLAAGERAVWFGRLWTRKEAYIKADGRGMSLRLDEIDVLTLPGRVRLRGNAPEEWTVSRRWTLRDLEVVPGYVAALAVDGPEVQVAYTDWASDDQ